MSIEEAAAVLSLQSSAAGMYSGGAQGYTASTAQQVGEWLRKQGGVADVEVPEGGAIWVEYSCGLLAVILPPGTGATPGVLNGAPLPAGLKVAESVGKTQQGATSPDLTPSSRGAAFSDLTPTSKRAAVFAFDEYRRPSGDLRSALRQAGYTLDDKDVFVGETFTVESLRSLSEYGVVYFNTHGVSENSKSGGYTILCTGQKATPELIHNTWDEFVSAVRDLSGRAVHGIGVATVPGATPATHWLMITNRFLGLNGIELQNALIMNHACSSLKSADMAGSFLNAGAALYVGWTNTSNCEHAEPVSAGLIRALGTPGTTFVDAWSTKAIVLPGWTQGYSAAELFPMVWLKDSNGNGDQAYVFHNGVRSGDPSDVGAEMACSLIYTPQGNAERFVLVPGSSGATAKLSLAGGGLPGGQVGAFYSTSLSAAGGVTPLNWRVTSGTLPSGLGMDGTRGAISGTPTKTGTSTFSVEVSDSSSTKQAIVAQFSIEVSSGATKPGLVGEGVPGTQGDTSYVATPPTPATTAPATAPTTSSSPERTLGFGEVHSVAFSPDGRFLAVGDGDGDYTTSSNVVYLVETEGWTVVRTLRAKAHQSSSGNSVFRGVNSVAFSPDGKLLASGSEDEMVTLWDVATGKMVRTLAIGAPGGHTDEVNSVAFSSDGKRLASGSQDGKVLVWDVTKGVPEYTLHVRHVEMLTDPHPPNANWVYSVAFFPQYNTMLVSGSLSGLMLWDFGKEPWEEVSKRDVEHIDARVYSVAFSPDGKLLAAGLGDDKRIMLLDVGRWTVARTLAGHTDSVNSVAFSPDGTLLASGSEDKTVKLWDVATGQVLNTFIGHAGSVNSVAFSPNGTLLASGSEDGTVKLWLVDDGK